MRYARAALCLTLLFAANARAQTTRPTFDRLTAEYASYVDVDDPLGFGAKVAAISSDPYKFWRGTKGLYFGWCRSNAADWLAGRRGPAHGDVHLGNVGTYATDLGHAAFGLVDFDDAIDLPPELDLLEACITTRLVARVQHVDADVGAIDRATFDAYRAALTSGRTATDLLADDPIVKKLLAKAAKANYADELAKFCTADGAFRHVILKHDKPTDLLTPIVAPAALDGLAAAIVEASGNDSTLASRMRVRDVAGVRAILRGACVRTRLGSSGSQGLSKILVRLDRPFRDVDGDLILYFKQQIPTAAERAGVATRGDLSPGERDARMADALTRPNPIVNGFATFESRSYAVGLKDPWADELDPASVDSPEALMQLARVMATALGAGHGAGGGGAAIAARLTPETLARLGERADRYVAEQQAWYESLAGDARAIALARRSERAVADAAK